LALNKLFSPEFLTLADKLKVPCHVFLETWSPAQNLALVKIVKKVEENWVSSSVGDKGTRTFWETAVAAAAPLFPDRQPR